MKLRYAILGVTAGAALCLASGCSKEEPPPGETPKAPAEPTAATEAVKAVGEAAAEAQKTVQSAATQAVAAATGAASEATAQAQTLIDKAKELVTNQKYQEALTSLQQLTNLKLTPEQQTIVDNLKAQIQAAMSKSATSNAASALGDILGGKK